MAVIENTFETKGTHLFFADTVTASTPAVTKLTCPTGISGLNGGTSDRIDTDCLSNTGKFRTNIPGKADPDDLSVPFILYKGDGSHQALFALHASGEVVSWMAGLSDSALSPTLDSNEALVTPETRTTFEFKASVANLVLDIANNEVVRGTLTLRPTGDTTPHWAA